jgi:predicted deacylase
VIVIPHCVVLVAPKDGRARPLVEPGAEVSSGEVVAAVETGGGTEEVRAPVSGRVGGHLAGARAHVSRGEGVVWLAR